MKMNGEEANLRPEPGCSLDVYAGLYIFLNNTGQLDLYVVLTG